MWLISMKRLLALIFLLLFVVGATIGTRDGGSIDTGTLLEGAAVGMSATEGQTIAGGGDACSSPEAVYEVVWTGEYSGDTDKACLNSGAANEDTAEEGTVITSGADLDGAYFLTLDDDNHSLVLTATLPTNIATLDSEGTVEIHIITPVMGAGDDIGLFQLHHDGSGRDDDVITTYIDGDTKTLYGRHEGDNNTHWTTTTIADSTEYWVQHTWSVSGSDHCIRACDDAACAGDSWECDSDALDAFGDNIDTIAFGDDDGIVNSGTGVYKTDTYILRNGYEGD